MSSNQMTLQPQELEEYIISTTYLNYAVLAGMTWYLYDYLLTLPLEITTVWQARVSGTTILFIINRYTFIVAWVFIVLEGLVVTRNDHDCILQFAMRTSFSSLYYTAIAVIFILRTYAVCGKNSMVIWLSIPLSIARFAISIWASIRVQAVIELIPNNYRVGTCNIIADFKSLSVEFISTVVFDGMIFLFTLSHTWALFGQARAAGIKANLVILLLRDGTIYFGLSSLALILCVIALYDANIPPLFSAFVQLYQPLAAVLANRIVLNLRSQGRPGSFPTNSARIEIFVSSVPVPNDGRRTIMDAIVGNIGDPLWLPGEEEGLVSEDSGDTGTGLFLLALLHTALIWAYCPCTCKSHDLTLRTPHRQNLDTSSCIKG